MAENENNSTAKFTDEGKLVVAMTKSLFAGNVDAAFIELKRHMQANGLKVSDEVISGFESDGLISYKNS